MSTSIHPYDPPQATLDPAPHTLSRIWPKHPTARALLLMATSILVFLASMPLAGSPWALRLHVVTASIAVATLLAVAGTFSGVQGIVLFARGASSVKAWGILGSLALTAAGSLLSFFTFVMALWSTSNFRRGRQLRRFGQVLLPPVTRGDAWARVDFVDLPANARVTAHQWRENGRTEHASVAAFAALTTDLMALGAPPALVIAANQDSLDEIRHTELCFSLARALDGNAQGPGPFSEARRAHRAVSPSFGRTFALARLAADSLVDGALHEGVSARVIAKLGRRCEVPEVRAMLKEIARDEGRHAAHGWDVVLWCASEGGMPVVNALSAALRALPATMLSPLPAEAKDGAWERFGIHGHALEEREYVAALGELRSRVAKLAAEMLPREEKLPEAC